MTHRPHPGTHTPTAGIAHLTGLTGPLIPLVIYAARRRGDAFAASEAVKAANFSFALVTVLILAVAVRTYVPLVGFLGTLALWVVPVAAIYFSLAGFWLARQGSPAHYPFQLKVVKTHD